MPQLYYHYSQRQQIFNLWCYARMALCATVRKSIVRRTVTYSNWSILHNKMQNIAKWYRSETFSELFLVFAFSSTKQSTKSNFLTLNYNILSMLLTQVFLMRCKNVFLQRIKKTWLSQSKSLGQTSLYRAQLLQVDFACKMFSKIYAFHFTR